jgi:ribonucleoside-diphosphate reductase alpha chain
LGTLQAGYTDFHYLRDIWKKTTEREALLGVSITGVASEPLLKLDFREASARTKVENKRIAKLIGIKPASRITCVKPAGTTSLVLGTSSGIHAWHDKFYIRRMRLGKNEAIYQYLKKTLPMLVEDEFFNPTKQAVLSIPVKAPEGAIDRSEDVEDLLERIKKLSSEWVAGGHTKGDNGHNVSATINIQDGDWDRVGKWMWANRDVYNGLACLPFDNTSYKQMPFETITEEKYNELSKHLRNINLDDVEELTDETDLKGELACTAGGCLI